MVFPASHVEEELRSISLDSTIPLQFSNALAVERFTYFILLWFGMRYFSSFFLSLALLSILHIVIGTVYFCDASQVCNWLILSWLPARSCLWWLEQAAELCLHVSARLVSKHWYQKWRQFCGKGFCCLSFFFLNQRPWTWSAKRPSSSCYDHSLFTME